MPISHEWHVKELTNQQCFHALLSDIIVLAWPSCRFMICRKDNDVGTRTGHFPTVSEVCFLSVRFGLFVMALHFWPFHSLSETKQKKKNICEEYSPMRSWNYLAKTSEVSRGDFENEPHILLLSNCFHQQHWPCLSAQTGTCSGHVMQPNGTVIWMLSIHKLPNMLFMCYWQKQKLLVL